jgi:cytochrome c peroxidase
LATPAIAQAPHRARVGFTGERLFQHQWEWKEHADELQLPNLEERERIVTRLDKRSDAYEDSLLSLGDGLGPVHNAKSCSECHIGGGASGVQHNVTLLTIDPRSEVIQQTETGARTLRELFPAFLSSDGMLQFSVVFHNESTRAGYESLRSGLTDAVHGRIDEEWFNPAKRTIAALSRKPVIAGRYKTIDFYLSQRNTPPLFGVGLIDRIDPARIELIADQQVELSGGSVSGRMAGKFGWRGQASSLTSFVADACSVELGLSHNFDGVGPTLFTRINLGGDVSSGRLQVASPQAEDPADPKYFHYGLDMRQSEVLLLASYVASLASPVERAQNEHSASDLLAGEKLFYAVGCASCHVADIHPVRGLFSDLLLHDMGPELEDPSPAPVGGLQIAMIPAVKFSIDNPRSVTSGRGSYEMSAQSTPVALRIPRPTVPCFPRGEHDSQQPSWDTLQREWRTPPLWGVADTSPYMHDGRAATLEEAIQWHGGEATPAKVRYKTLTDEEKWKVIAFLLSLRAPM